MFEHIQSKGDIIFFCWKLFSPGLVKINGVLPESAILHGMLINNSYGNSPFSLRAGNRFAGAPANIDHLPAFFNKKVPNIMV